MPTPPSRSSAPRRKRRPRRRPTSAAGARPPAAAPPPRPARPAPTAPPARAFTALGLSDALGSAVAEAGYTVPTPIQTKAIPHVLAGTDLLGCAQTGTGKTAAFALPMLQRMFAGPPPERADGRRVRPIQALVLAPTRELASQIGASFETYARGHDFRCHVVFGGVGKQPQLDALRRGIDVLVATPGRLLDLMGDGVVDLSRVSTLVLDEADRMLDMGFIHDVRKIVRAVPDERQTLLFSATMPKEIEDLARRTLASPVRVAVDPIASTCEPIEQSVYFVDKRHKVDLLLSLLHDSTIDRALVFTRTKHEANKVSQRLEGASVSAAALHGNKSQSARERALDGFKRGEIRVVVATDLAARGIDVKDLSHVINFHLPADAESYVHRVGRTGRAGKSGIALSFCAPDERPHLAGIERLTRRELVRKETPGDLPSTAAHAEDAVPRRSPARPASRGPRAGSAPSKAGGRASNGSDAPATPRRRRSRRRRAPAGQRSARDS